MSYSDKIGIVIPCWNVQAWIEDALASLVQQESTQWSCVIVDDGSTDHTLIRVNAYLARRARIWSASGQVQLITREHGGLVSAVAHGMAHLATYAEPPAYLTCLAADDHLSGNYVLALLKALTDNPDTPCVYPMVREFGERAGYWQPPSWAPRLVVHATTVPGCAVWRRGVWNRLGGFDPQFRHGFEDWDLAARAEAAGFFTVSTPPLIVPEAIYYHRAHGASLTDTMTDQYKKWAKDLIATRLAPPPLPPSFPGKAAEIVQGPYILDT